MKTGCGGKLPLSTLRIHARELMPTVTLAITGEITVLLLTAAHKHTWDLRLSLRLRPGM